MKIGNRQFADKDKTYVMGILNVTPDSFSDGGKYACVEHALKRTETMIAEGVDIVDVGGESTRPGYTRISSEEEIQRVVPVIEAIKKRFDIPISLDTYKVDVAEAGIASGADLINDIWGLQYEAEMAHVIAKNDVACCLMHNRKEAVYTHFLEEVKEDLSRSVALAKEAGIGEDKIMLDPGVGFAKSYEQNMEIIRNLEQFQSYGYPVLLGASRKSVIGLTLDLPTEERLEGTLVTTAFAVLQGCSFVRVHDVQANVRAIKMAEALWQGRQ